MPTPALPLFAALAAALLSAAPPTLAAPTVPHRVAKLAAPGPVVTGSARFTVITPTCVRIEYAPDGKFQDAPSLFAVRRTARAPFRLAQTGGATVLDTGRIRLTYTPDGGPLSPANLQAEIKDGAKTVRWTPGLADPDNLGGTIRTLDGVHEPVNLGQGVLSRSGWAVVDDSHTPLLTAAWVRSRPLSSSLTASTDWYLFGAGHDYHAALKSLAAVGGPVPLPRRYALGAWYSRYWPYSSRDYKQIVGEYTRHDFPLDNIVLDMDWHRDGWTGWSWNRTLLPDAETLLPWFHLQGLHVTLNLHPADGVGPQEDAYPQLMRDLGADPATKQTLPFDAGDPKYMAALFSDVFAPLEKNGVDFWWLDWQQGPYTRSIPELTNLFWLNTLLYDRTARNGERGLSFSRWAGWGDHRHPIHFSGDADSDFPTLAFEVPFTATAGNVGCFFWSHDIGGHNGRRNEESYTRWVQFGAVSPVLRSHSTRDVSMDRRPWTYPAWAEESMRGSFHLRSELFPYLYTSAAQAARETVPLDRPLYFDYPHAEAAYHNAQEFLLGDNILAAPIVSEGVGPGRVGTQTVWFPPGVWYNSFTGERFLGNTEALVAADINEFPLYVRGGVPVPLQPYRARMATATLTTLRVVCRPGADRKTGRSTLYEDDGVSTAYTRGQSATTPLSYARRGDLISVTVGASKGHYKGQPMVRALAIELPDTTRATSATLDGKPIAVRYDKTTWTNFVTIPAWPIGKAAAVVVQAKPGGWDILGERAARRRLAGVGARSPLSVSDALASPGLAPAQTDAALAVSGIGLVAHNEGAYLYGGAIKNYFYAPPGAVKGNQIKVTGGATLTLPPGGESLLVPVLTRTWRGRAVADPVEVTFRVGEKTFTQRVPGTATALMSLDNIAQYARVTVSGVESGYSLDGATDGIAGGYPGPKNEEWSAGAKVGAAITLTWNAPQTIERIALYDRPNTNDQVLAGEITFSDGSHVPVGPLPDDGAAPLEVRFAPKTVTSLTFKVLAVKPTTENAGLSEIAVYRAK